MDIKTDVKLSKYSFSRSFQESAVALMLREPQFVDRYQDVLNPQFFTADDLSCIARLILNHFNKYRQIPQHLDQVVIEYAAKLSSNAQDAEKIARPLMHLAAKLTDKDLSDSEYVIDNIVKFGRFQSVVQGLHDALEIARGDDSPDGAGYDDVLNIIQKSLSIGKGANCDLIGSECLDNIFEICAENNAARIASYIDLLDLDMKGGLGPGELGSVVAPSGVGKSLSLNQFTVSALRQDKPVLYVTCELDQKQILVRIAAALFDIPLDDFQNPTKDTIENYNHQLQSLRDKVGYIPFKIQHFNPKTATVASVRSTITHLKSKDGFDPKLLIVDYADELRASGAMYKQDASTYIEMGSVYKELRSLAYDLQVPVWTASQTNREGVKTSRSGKAICDMESLADSYMKSMVSDAVLTLNQTNEEQLNGFCRLFVAKMRNGKKGRIIDVCIDYPKMQMKQADYQYSHEQYYNSQN